MTISAFLNHRKVYHKNQRAVENYERTSQGWDFVPAAVAGDWPAGSFDYIEQVHNLDAMPCGLYGRVIGPDGGTI